MSPTGNRSRTGQHDELEAAGIELLLEHTAALIDARRAASLQPA